MVLRIGMVLRPSSSSNRTKKKLKQIFGTDSEIESEDEKNETARLFKERTIDQTRKDLELTESESEKEKEEDVLEITIENDIFKAVTSPSHNREEFVTPSKLQQLKQVPPLISPLSKTPQPAKQQPLFATSPYSICVQSPIQLHKTQTNEVFSQLYVTIHNNTRYEEYLQQRTQTIKDSTPLKRIDFKPYIRIERDRTTPLANSFAYAQKPNAPITQQKSHAHNQIAKEAEHQPKSKCEVV